MNASYRWLNAFVPSGLSPEALRDVITARACTIDELVPLRQDLADVVVGRVVEAARHPNADHLWVTKVDAGRGELLEVVCGAPNVREGRLYPFAPAGATLPGGVTLERRKIRGITSNGMLCSARELRLGEEHDGILELRVDATPGTPLLAALPAADTRLVVDVSPNRPDLLSHLGLAREISAATGVAMHLPELPGGDGAAVPEVVRAEAAGGTGGVRVELADSAGCPRYMGMVIRGVSIGPSPAWLTDRLTAVGARPVNNVVDATNYLLHEVGQPMHAFDLGKLAGPAVVVRRARPGETLRTLDGVERMLDGTMTVIADAERAQAIAGVMGGAESEVTEGTVDIFLEVATFEPRSVRATRRALGLSTDASYRFERGTDLEGPPGALARAARLIRAVAGGQVDAAPIDLYPHPRIQRTVELRVDRVGRLLGEPVPSAEIAALLRPIGFEASEVAETGEPDDSAGSRPDTARFSVAVPSWRPDVVREVDLIEEVARLRGYDSLPDALRPFRLGNVPESSLAIVSRRVRETLVAAGLMEARPMPFVRGAPTGFVRVANPLAESEAYLRRDLLDSLARRAEYNLAHMQGNVRLFEIGSAFTPSDEGSLPVEQVRVAALVMGDRRPPHWTEQRPPAIDEWDAKALAESIARASEPRGELELRSGEGDLLWNILLEGMTRGHVRRLALDAPVWAAPAFGVEMMLAKLDASPVQQPDADETREPVRTAAKSVHPVSLAAEQAHARYQYRPLPTTPAAEFDLALLVPRSLPSAQVERVIREASGGLLERLMLFDQYSGSDVPDGYRSLAWRLTFRHPRRTLEHPEIAGRREKLVRTLERELGVRQRTA